MSNLSIFFKKNKKKRENISHIVTKSFCDDKGEPIPWEIKPLTTKEEKAIRESCTDEIQITGKPHLFRSKLRADEYGAKLMAAAVVFPDLYNAELQDSYGTKTPEELLSEMIDEPGEYNAFAEFVQKMNGFNVSMDEKAKEAKN